MKTKHIKLLAQRVNLTVYGLHLNKPGLKKERADSFHQHMYEAKNRDRRESLMLSTMKKKRASGLNFVI